MVLGSVLRPPRVSLKAVLPEQCPQGATFEPTATIVVALETLVYVLQGDNCVVSCFCVRDTTLLEKLAHASEQTLSFPPWHPWFFALVEDLPAQSLAPRPEMPRAPE